MFPSDVPARPDWMVEFGSGDTIKDYQDGSGIAHHPRNSRGRDSQPPARLTQMTVGLQSKPCCLTLPTAARPWRAQESR